MSGSQNLSRPIAFLFNFVLIWALGLKRVHYYPVSQMSNELAKIIGKLGPEASDQFFKWWGIYRNTPNFAVVKVSGECIGNSLDVIAEDLAMLQTLGLPPVVSHGWGGELTRRLQSLGISTMQVDGDRYTDGAIMPHVEEIAVEYGRKLTDAINSSGGRAKFIDFGATFIAKDKAVGEYGTNNGDISYVDLSGIEMALNEGFIPIVSPVGRSEDGTKTYNINSATASAELVKKLDPFKFILLTSSKGVLDKNGRPILEITLRRDLDKLVAEGVLKGGMLKNVDEVKRSLEYRANGDDRSGQIVNPGNLPVELFTDRGDGTYVRRGYVVVTSPIGSVNINIVRDIVSRRLGETLNLSYGNGQKIIFHERNFKGFGIVMPKAVAGIDYLDLYAVDTGYERRGLGTDILNAIGDWQGGDLKTFWRTRIDRRSNPFYAGISDGSQTFTSSDGITYKGYWKGLDFATEVQPALAYMGGKPSNFVKP